MFDPARLDALFRHTAQRQYQKEFLFSQIVELLGAVAVLRQAARRVRPADYAKTKRGPKKSPPAKGTCQIWGHVSTHKLLQQRRQQ